MKLQIKWLALIYLLAMSALALVEFSQFSAMQSVRNQISESYNLISGRDEGLRFEVEYRRFHAKVTAYVKQRGSVSHDEVLTWFDIFWSRVHSIAINASIPDGVDVAQAESLFKEIRETVRQIDPVVQQLQPGDLESLETISKSLGNFDDQITKLAVAISKARVGQASSLQNKLDMALEGIDRLLITSTTGAALILTLFGFEAYHARNAERKIKVRESRVRFLAEHDPLTNLGNRAYLNIKLKDFIQYSNSMNEPFHLLMLDLDKFKDVNDTFGHPVGDQLLKRAAQRLLKSFRPADEVVRLGGDEFAVLIRCDVKNLEKAVRRVISAFSTPFMINNREIHISTSVGISSYPTLSKTAENLMRDADLALYSAKSRGRDTFATYEHSMTTEIKHRMGLELDLRRAVQCQSPEIEVHYQPLVELDTANGKQAKIVAVEALVRWFHPEQGLIPPTTVISIAEGCGIIDKLSTLVLRQACEDAVFWQKAGHHPQLSVNLSPLQFNNRHLPDEIMQVLRETGFSASNLALEITESIEVFDFKLAVSLIETLAAQGISFTMDDFGTGFSNLGYLKSLPLDCLKIDRSFVMHIEKNEEDRKLVRGIVHLAQGMGLKVVAEGIETEEQANFLRTLNCDIGQGFLYGRAMNKLKLLGVLQNSEVIAPSTSEPRLLESSVGSSA